MEEKDKLSLLEYKIKLMHSIITSMDSYEHDFFSYVIDHHITEKQTSIIIKSLTILKERMENSTISDFTKSLCEDIEELNMLIINTAPTFEEFKKFIAVQIGNEINPEFLLKSLKKQKINIRICDFLLEDLANQKQI